MDLDVMERFDRIEKLVLDGAKAQDEKIMELSGRVRSIESQMHAQIAINKQTGDNLHTAMRILTRLVNDRAAVIREDGQSCALDSQRVTEAAIGAKTGRKALLKEWDRQGRIDKDNESGKTRYTKKVQIGGERVRAVVVIKI